MVVMSSTTLLTERANVILSIPKDAFLLSAEEAADELRRLCLKLDRSDIQLHPISWIHTEAWIKLNTISLYVDPALEPHLTEFEHYRIRVIRMNVQNKSRPDKYMRKDEYQPEERFLLRWKL